MHGKKHRLKMKSTWTVKLVNYYNAIHNCSISQDRKANQYILPNHDGRPWFRTQGISYGFREYNFKRYFQRGKHILHPSNLTKKLNLNEAQNTGGVSFCWIGIRNAILYTQNYTPPHCLFLQFFRWGREANLLKIIVKSSDIFATLY